MLNGLPPITTPQVTSVVMTTENSVVNVTYTRRTY